jgi:hypothetical protein
MAKFTPWAVLLCRFKDTGQTIIPLELTNKLFTSAGNGTFNVPHFFKDMSHGLLDLSGSQVFPQSPEYFTVDAMLNDYVPPTEPPPPGWQPKITRDELVARARQAAESAGVPLKQFYGVVIVFNAAIGITFGGIFTTGPAAVSDYRWVTSNGTSSHGQEMAHAYGLYGHSRLDGTMTDYTDRWDIMSTANAFMAPDPVFNLRGPGMNAANMRYLGWLDSTRVWRPSRLNMDEIVQLRPLHRRDLPGYLAAELPPFGTGLIVEYRTKEDWDAAIPRSAVLIHDFYAGNSYLLTSKSGSPDMVKGDRLELNANAHLLPHQAIEVLNIDNGNQVATVRFTSAEIFPDDWRGVFNQVFGQIASDGGGVIWDGRRFVPVPPRNPMVRVLDLIGEFSTAEQIHEPFLQNNVRRHAVTAMSEILAAVARQLEPIQEPLGKPAPRRSIQQDEIIQQTESRTEMADPPAEAADPAAEVADPPKDDHT